LPRLTEALDQAISSGVKLKRLHLPAGLIIQVSPKSLSGQPFGQYAQRKRFLRHLVVSGQPHKRQRDVSSDVGKFPTGLPQCHHGLVESSAALFE
jgi:hypothetical protein